MLVLVNPHIQSSAKNKQNILQLFSLFYNIDFI